MGSCDKIEGETKPRAKVIFVEVIEILDGSGSALLPVYPGLYTLPGAKVKYNRASSDPKISSTR